MGTALEPTILLVEDNGDDVFWLKRALHKAGFAAHIYVAQNGEEAVAYLGGEGEFADRTKHPFPKMVITDLKMPKMNGFELVQWLRAEPKLSQLPIIVLSSSNLEADRAKARELGANIFFTKPMCPEDFVPLVKFIRECGARPTVHVTPAIEKSKTQRLHF